MKEIASRFFTFENGEREVNRNLNLSNFSEKEKISLLLQIIELWDNVFCLHGANDTFGYHIIEKCPRCISSQKILAKIFDDCCAFDAFPFTKMGKNHLTIFSLKDLRAYVK